MLAMRAGLVMSPGWTASRMVLGSGRLLASAATSSEERRRMGVRLAQVMTGLFASTVPVVGFQTRQ